MYRLTVVNDTFSRSWTAPILVTRCLLNYGQYPIRKCLQIWMRHCNNLKSVKVYNPIETYGVYQCLWFAYLVNDIPLE